MVHRVSLLLGVGWPTPNTQQKRSLNVNSFYLDDQ
jgi:hypothetical protein